MGDYSLVSVRRANRLFHVRHGSSLFLADKRDSFERIQACNGARLFTHLIIKIP